MSFEKFTSSKEVSDGTARVYRSKLNKLAKEGFATIYELETKPYYVIQAVAKLVSEISPEEKKRAEGRLFFSSIFYALHDKIPKYQPSGLMYTNPSDFYRSAFHKYDPLVTTDGKPWLKLAEFQKQG